MATVSMLGQGGVVEIRDYIKSRRGNMGSSCQCKDEVTHLVDGAGTCLIVFDKYYMRTGGYTSLSVSIAGDDEAVYVDGITAGGGEGPFNFSYGSEVNFLKSFIAIMTEKGFRQVKE